MKIIPYIRFLIAFLVLVGFLNRLINTDDLSQIPELMLFILFGIIFLNFILYSIIVGIQELTNTTLIHAKTFIITGFLIEIMLLLVDLFGLYLFLQYDTLTWITVVMIIDSMGLIVLITFDAKKMMMKKLLTTSGSRQPGINKPEHPLR